jgi:hypothetical protein
MPGVYSASNKMANIYKQPIKGVNSSKNTNVTNIFQSMNTEATSGPKQNLKFNPAHISINSGVNIGGVHANKDLGFTSDTNHLDYLSAPGESYIMPSLPNNTFVG